MAIAEFNLFLIKNKSSYSWNMEDIALSFELIVINFISFFKA